MVSRGRALSSTARPCEKMAKSPVAVGPERGWGCGLCPLLGTRAALQGRHHTPGRAQWWALRTQQRGCMVWTGKRE